MMTALLGTTRVLLVDDHSVVRAGIRTLLSDDSDIEIVGEADCVGEALTEIVRQTPDIVLLDVRMPDGNGFEVCREIKRRGLNTKFIILSAFDDDDIVMEAVKVGADGFLLKEIDAPALSKALKTVAQGNSILDPAITKRVLGRMKNLSEAPPKSRLDILSRQERRVLELVAQGKTNKEIGLDLGLSDKTVKNYLRNLMEKLKLSRRSEAAAFYVRETGK
jgi:two-component system response regulator DevR